MNDQRWRGQQLPESQDSQLIGQCSPDLDRVAAERQGWIGDTDTKPLGAEITDGSDFSFRDRRANKQALSWDPGFGPMAAHTETPMAALTVQPYDQFCGPEMDR